MTVAVAACERAGKIIAIGMKWMQRKNMKIFGCFFFSSFLLPLFSLPLFCFTCNLQAHLLNYNTQKTQKKKKIFSLLLHFVCSLCISSFALLRIILIFYLSLLNIFQSIYIKQHIIHTEHRHWDLPMFFFSSFWLAPRRSTHTS